MMYLPLFLIVPIDMYANNVPVWILFVAGYVFWAAHCLRNVRKP